ncbi:hypothetical protein CK203_010007 [Vitis vinifera]|uniref:Uncharacterized protein n=1 Tax=Vitis vinifera TaxID=29760 RepID=A0A438JVH2_VITVI|nr:hypothetical protein CK203_010007 [Vitis vinifera]
MKKGGLIMVEYLLKMKGIVDALASTNHVVSKEDKILLVLASLGPEDDAFIVFITSRSEPFKFEDIATLLKEEDDQTIHLNMEEDEPVVDIIKA